MPSNELNEKVRSGDLSVSNEQARGHLAHLDGVRALAALVVLVGHASLEVWPRYTSHIRPTGAARWISMCTSYGHYAVSVFIVLSGFCLMLPVVRRDGVLVGGALQFFKRRARRILPPYYLAMACSLILIATCIGHKTGTHWDTSLPVTTKGILAHILLVQDIYGSPQINHVFWSIAVEWQIYFIFPLAVLFSRRLGSVQSTLTIVMLSLIMVRLTRNTILSEMTFQYYGLFAVGMLGATIGYSSQSSFSHYRERLPWMLLVIPMVLAAAGLHHLQKSWFADYFVGLAATALLVGMSGAGDTAIRKLLSARPLAFLGTFAYSIYLIHAPLIQVVWQYGIRPLHLGEIATFGVLAFVGCPLVLFASYVFFLLCERPFLVRSKRQSPSLQTNSPSDGVSYAGEST